MFADHPLFNSNYERLKTDFNAVGELTGEYDDIGVQLVNRPDGRVKRFFEVKGYRDVRKVGRRKRELPELTLLHEHELTLPNADEVNHNVVLIENTLLEFDIDIDVIDVQVGPTVTRYAVQPYKITPNGREIIDRTRISKILSYTNDLALSLSAKRIRMEAPVAGERYLGVEVPNKQASTVSLKSLIENKVYYDLQQKRKSPLVVPLGRDVAGKPTVIDLGAMPHLLIAGTTGSGKSVAITAMATSIILNNTPEKVRMVMIDPKRVELSRFNGIPHLLGPVETDIDRSVGVLRWCTREMERRYKLLEEHSTRNIATYNEQRGRRDFLPYVVIFIDEIGDLMNNSPEETEKNLARIAQMARAVGMHLVVATQRPSVDIITGLIKANFPARISFSVASGVDSRVIIDTTGAESLLGSGDMLYLAPDAPTPRRIQGCFVSDQEANDIIGHWKAWREKRVKANRIAAEMIAPWEQGVTRSRFIGATDPMIEEAIKLVIAKQEASATMLQRELELGYPRAARIVDILEEMGVIGANEGGGKSREVLIQDYTMEALMRQYLSEIR